MKSPDLRVIIVLGLLLALGGVYALSSGLDQTGGTGSAQQEQQGGDGAEGAGDSLTDQQNQSSDLVPESYDQLPVGSIESFTTGSFVPYWSSFDGLSAAQLDQLWYFGVVPTVDGVDRDEPGYAKLAAFMAATEDAGNTDRYLTLRMVDRSTAAEILSTAASWQKIADDTRAIVAEHGFDGVVLNLEVGLQAFASSETDITRFSTFLSEEFAKDDLPMAMTLYGDTVYRARPYDLAGLAPVADQFLVMTYDFHKSFGLPGPNFPLSRGQEHDYDLSMMLSDLTVEIPPEKLTVVFGMYGYSWSVDDQGRPLKTATAVTVHEAEALKQDCAHESDCQLRRDPVSAETEIRMPDDGRTTVIWYEDPTSLQRKLPVLESEGIGGVGTWAWGYYDPAAF